MKDILQDIIAWKRVEVEAAKKALPEHEIHAIVEKMIAEGSTVASMSQALRCSETGIIAEFKRKSPSKGWIKETGKADIIPLDYQTNGASAISILTDERFFGGKDEFIVAARKSGVTIPVLYKNFVIDEYQVFQARQCGASAVLLIAANLEKSQCRQLARTAHELGLEVLLETHSENEIEYGVAEPDMWGVNNRNLGTFITDVNNSFRMAELLPKDACKVSESGISNPDTIKDLRQAGYNGFLIGECFMKEDNPGKALDRIIKMIKL